MPRAQANFECQRRLTANFTAQHTDAGVHITSYPVSARGSPFTGDAV